MYAFPGHEGAEWQRGALRSVIVLYRELERSSFSPKLSSIAVVLLPSPTTLLLSSPTLVLILIPRMLWISRIMSGNSSTKIQVSFNYYFLHIFPC